MSKECKWVWVEIEEFGDRNMQNSSYLKTQLATECSLLIGLYKYIPVSIHVEKQAARWDSVALFLMGNIVHSWTPTSPFLTHHPESLEAFSSCVQCEEAQPAAPRELKTSQLCPSNKGPAFTAFSPCLTDLIWVLALNMSEWEGRLVMPFIVIIILLVCFFARRRGGKCSCLALCEEKWISVQLPRPGVSPTESKCPAGLQLASQFPFSGQKARDKRELRGEASLFSHWLIAQVRRCWYYNLKEYF